MKRSKKGFTLIDLLFVIAILGVLVTVAINGQQQESSHSETAP